MKKIPTLFVRIFENHKLTGITSEFLYEEFRDILKVATPTIKWDGTCCAVIDGEFYKRYDAKKGKPIPEGAIKCQEEPDPENKADKWFVEAYRNTFDEWVEIVGPYVDSFMSSLPNDTHEAIGPHFQGNPYGLEKDILVPHGKDKAVWDDTPLNSFNNIRAYLNMHNVEGLVYWYDGRPVFKIKRTDFGYKWPVKK
jgi:hypothetical protein